MNELDQIKEELRGHKLLLEQNQAEHDALKIEHDKVLDEKEAMRRCIMELVLTMTNDELVEYVVILNKRILLNKG